MHNAFMREIHERLKWAREHAGYETAAAAAQALGVKEPTYMGHENGSRGFPLDRAERYARKFKVSLEWLLTGRGSPTKGVLPTARAAGYIGAGAEFLPVDDHAPGGGLEEVEIPPGVPLDAVLVIVRGDSMHPRYFDGEYLFYLRDQRPPAELLNRECVVKLPDGRMFVKMLRRGSQHGLFNLESWNASIIEDQPVDWAAPVVARVNKQRAA